MRCWLPYLVAGWLLVNHQWEATSDHVPDACSWHDKVTSWACLWYAAPNYPNAPQDISPAFLDPAWDPVEHPLPAGWVGSPAPDQSAPAVDPQ